MIDTNKKILNALKAEEEKRQEIKNAHTFTDQLEDALEWYVRNAPDEEDHIIHLENVLDKLYKKIDTLEHEIN